MEPIVLRPINPLDLGLLAHVARACERRAGVVLYSPTLVTVETSSEVETAHVRALLALHVANLVTVEQGGTFYVSRTNA